MAPMAGGMKTSATSPLFRKFQPKPKAFIIFADLDGTFTPMDLHGKIEFVNVIKEIRALTGAVVKFVPVSGRPSGYVLRILHDCRDMLKGEGITDCCEYGAAEQGALIVDSSKSYGPQFTGNPNHMDLKEQVAEVLDTHKHSSIVKDEPDKLYTCSIHIENEVAVNMTKDEQMDIYRSLRDAIDEKLGKKLPLFMAMSHNCLEVMTSEISKAYAINFLLTRYSRKYNIVGCMYGGDAENDKVAMLYVSKLAEIPGVHAHNFTPGNAQESISSRHIDSWKYNNHIAARGLVQKAKAPLFLGIAELIRKALKQNQLVGSGVTEWQTCDDSKFVRLKMRQELEKPFRAGEQHVYTVAAPGALRRSISFDEMHTTEKCKCGKVHHNKSESLLRPNDSMRSADVYY